MARGPQWEHLSLLAGNESVAELRNLIALLCQECPASRNHFHCPFRVMSGLSYATMTEVVKNLPRESCLSLFEMELNCRAQAGASCHLLKKQPPP